MKTDRIAIFDTTLRDGEQCPGASMNQREKLEIARQLARLNVDVIEAGFPVISEGDFDFYLVQPCSPLFRMTCSSVDFLDIITIIPVIVMTGMVFARLPPLGWERYAAYGLLMANGVALIYAIHILVAALAVRTQELESAIWIYRDVMFMGKFPVDVYAPAVRWALTIGIPIAVMTTFPAKALLGRLSPLWVAYAFALTAVALPLSWLFWKNSVARYTSSSS